MPASFDPESLAYTASFQGESDQDGFRPDLRDDDGLYAEITERRAQLENADILRGARAL